MKQPDVGAALAARLSVCVAYLSAVGALACAPANTDRHAPAEGPAAAEVRAARARFNTAIAARDTQAIAQVLLPDYHIVTGKSVQDHGATAETKLWSAMFADTTLGYVRQPREVRVNDSWGLAEELGDWSGHFTATDGVVHASGSYAAKWQRDTNGHWRLQVEVFTTLACDGGAQGCSPPGPVSP